MTSRLALLFCLLATPVAAGAQGSASGAAELDPALSLRAPRMAVGVLSTNTVVFAGGAVALWVQTAREGRYECPPNGGFCLDFGDVFAPAYGFAGAISMGMSLWSIALLPRSTRELRARRRGEIDYARSISFDRRLSPHYMVSALLYLGASVAPLIVAADETTTWLPAFGGAAFIALAGFNLWAFAVHHRELKARRHGEQASTQSAYRRVRPTAAGFQW